MEPPFSLKYVRHGVLGTSVTYTGGISDAAQWLQWPFDYRTSPDISPLMAEQTMGGEELEPSAFFLHHTVSFKDSERAFTVPKTHRLTET